MEIDWWIELENTYKTRLAQRKDLPNRILNTEQDVRSKHPLEILMDNVPEDFGIMLRDDKTGSYILRAGVICSSIGWSLDEKIGLPLGLVHEPVPEYKEKMETPMERYVSLTPRKHMIVS